MTAELETGPPAPPEAGSPVPRTRWETIIWPRWLPVRARLPLIAQIAGASALVAAIAMPRWSTLAEAPPVDPPAPIAMPVVAAAAPARVVADAPPARPAHLNLDVRHAFKSVDLSVSVDGKRVLNTKLEGSGKRFKVFGKRAERGFTKSLELSPGVRVVRVRMKSDADKFDQTRVERFDLDSSAVAAMRIAADRSGLSVDLDRPLPAERPVVQAVPQMTQAVQAAAAVQAVQIAQAGQVAQAQQASALAELYQALRSILIAVAGVVASAATGVFVQEFLKSRKSLMRL